MNIKSIVIVLALLVAGAVQAHEHQMQTQTMNFGTASILDGQRQALLHCAEFEAAGIPCGLPEAFVSEARLFRAEFIAEMDSFNKQQVVRDPALVKQAMDGFYSWRDSRVGNHWITAQNKMSQPEIAQVEDRLQFQMAMMRSTNPPKPETASLAAQWPNNGTTTGCGPYVSCNIAYSLGLTSNATSTPAAQEKVHDQSCCGGRDILHYYLESDSNDSYNPIIDGGTTMNCPPACNGNPVHTPSVQLQYNNGTTYYANGGNTCGNCYQYASGVWTFWSRWTTPAGPATGDLVGAQSGPVDISDGGKLTCTIAGVFLTAGLWHWPWEMALTMTHLHSTTPFSTTTGTWVYPDVGSPRNSFDNVNMGYYTQDNYCQGVTLTPPAGFDLDMSSFLTAMPQAYVSGGVMLSSSCGHSFQSVCPIVQQEGIYAIAKAAMWHYPGGNQWYIIDFQESQLAYPNSIWEKPLYYWTGEMGSAQPKQPSCTWSGVISSDGTHYIPAPAKAYPKEQKP